MKTVLAIGAHIGDMDLTAGPMLAEHILGGGRAVILALTPGERGHPKLDPDTYKKQKLAEGRQFAHDIGAEFACFDDLSDGYLTTGDEVAERIAALIRDIRPHTVIAHWRHSIHSDHENASVLAERARFLAGLPQQGLTRHPVTALYYAENWEDAEGFTPSRYVPVSAAAYDAWRAAIAEQAFARGETYGFRYIDYYTAQMTMRGCLAGTERACALAFPSHERPAVTPLRAG
ncbi:PIG-L family deacetylase [Streptomyces sp. A7024]|uniref:PIG-L family deacetylase n=1 Tax=Streptomyces coryli TaxID=1128680 RepID=A0A6G4U4P0_9ACTN|nr:PIG-L family deacetylase [Streptomyces coryli]NGN66972.1 PIG-L family deacetylase [Streptomyces coryli]